jgi:beta-N-acetylhexosaminidase
MYKAQVRKSQKNRYKSKIKINRPLVLLFSLLGVNFILFVLILFTNLKATSLEGISPINSSEVSNSYHSYRTEKLVTTTFSQMSLDEKIGQMIMVSITGTRVNTNTTSLIQDYEVGGVIIMSANLASQTQVTQLINDLQELTTVSLLIATDQEGGVVARIPWDDARYISQPHIGIVNREDFAYSAGEDHAQALKNISINMNLAPVLDISLVSGSTMASRTLGASPDKVAVLGTQIIKAHQDQDIIATAKHFPGIGRSATDSHATLPEIDISKEQLTSEELIPFKAAIDQGIDVIMIGHALYPQVDSEYPASLSEIIITDILRGELGFEGVVISDDIKMGALSGYPNRAVDAINAGTDIILIVDTYQNEINYINQIKAAVEDGTLSEERIADSVRRILRLKFKY